MRQSATGPPVSAWVDYDLEQLATHTLEILDLGAPVDADRLAARIGATVLDGGPGCEGLYIPGPDLIVVDDSARPERRSFALAHEVGHLMLDRAGLPNTERGANYLASALLLPRDDFDRDLRALGWDLLHLRARHPGASFEALMRRVVALRDGARGWVFDRPLRPGAAPRRYSVPGRLRLAALEREAAQAAAEAGAPVQVVPGVEAWPIFQADWRRVIVLSDSESLRCYS